MYKSKSEFKDVQADVCYDVLQDSDYRYKWDKYLMTTTRIGYLDQNNDVCYYTVGSLPPFRNRDFVLLRSWADLGKEKFILAHSVWHDKFPPTKDYIRGTVYLTINYVKALEKGCQFTYLTLVDPKGKLPNWLINRVTKTIAPRLCKKLRKACLGYDRWKRKHKKTEENNFWRIKEMKDMTIPKLELTDCVYKGEEISEEWPDESGIQPNAVDDEEKEEEEEDDEEGGKK
uniref:START domain-containing protein n=1 Tax=Meloidogyne enterolobii TaxID=390850 RepID=A0A6V7XGF4_MELEN|nr:unnamed protein product [Meloidogyne enterolobii]